MNANVHPPGSNTPSRGEKLLGSARGATALALVLGVLYAINHFELQTHGGGGLFAVGFLLIAGLVGGRVAALIGMPRLTGYLAVGVLAGPSAFALFDQHDVQTLTLINHLALALIALQAGAELTTSMLRRSGLSLLYASLGHVVVITLGMTGLFFILTQNMPFLQGLTWQARLAIAGVWGAMAVSKAPADTLAILGEARAKGPLSEHALGVVVLLDVGVLIVFAVAMMFAAAATDPGAHLSMEAFKHLGEELFASVAAGTTFGLLIALYFWAVRQERLLFTVVIAYGVTAFCAYFHYDTLLVFVVAGFVVMNLTREGHHLIETTESASAAVMVVFFATAGAQLDLAGLKTAGGIAAGLTFGRICFTWLGCQLGHRLSNDPPLVRRYAFSSFISQAGVTIGLAAVAAEVLGPVGEGLKTLVIAVIGMNELIGPVAFKFALGRSGEAGRADLPDDSASEEEEQHTIGSDVVDGATDGAAKEATKMTEVKNPKP